MRKLYGLLIMLFVLIVIGGSIYFIGDNYHNYSITVLILLVGMFVTGLLPNKSGRIRKNEYGGKITYTVEQLHDVFRWSWTDAWVNSIDGAAANDTYNTLEEAQEHLGWLTGKNKVQHTIIAQ